MTVVASAAAPFLAGDGLTKRYGGIVALDGAEYSAEEGEVHALLGENGAGKSTFIKMLSGAVAPDAGWVRIGSERFERLTPRESRARGVSCVFQDLSLIPALTAAENIWFGHEPQTPLRTLSARKMVRRSAALIGRLGFPEFPLDLPVHQLPIRHRQVVEIVKAVAVEPKILVLDEATSALAPAETLIVLEMTRRLAADGTLCIFISHRLREVRRVADRVTVFRNGRTVGTRSIAQTSDDELVEMIIGRRLEQLYPKRRARARDDVVLRCSSVSAGARLKSATFALHRGEILGVGGLQGQGQLELFLRLYGVLGGGGEIEIHGSPVRLRSPRDALSAGIGCALIPEDRQGEGLLLGKSIRENIALARLRSVSRLGCISPERERELANTAIRSLGIAARSCEQPVQTLSGGNQQKVVIGRFLYPDIEVLLCYDPTRGVDIGAKHDIFELLEEQAASGRAVLFFSTDNQELTNVADRIAVLAGGEVSAIIDAAEATDAAIIRASMAVGAAA